MLIYSAPTPSVNPFDLFPGSRRPTRRELFSDAQHHFIFSGRLWRYDLKIGLCALGRFGFGLFGGFRVEQPIRERGGPVAFLPTGGRLPRLRTS
jgi:hypothetical protein